MEKDRPLMAVMLVVIAAMLLIVSATNHTVGGAASGWDLSSDISSWSAKTSFHDVFNYTPLHDVLEVNATEFAACKTIDPMGAYTDGETVIPLGQAGVTRYFICGRGDHCSRGLKLRVHILQKAPSSTTARRGKGAGRGKQRRPPYSRPHQHPTHSHHEDKNAPSPDSGAWDRKRDWMQWCRLLLGFLAVAPVNLCVPF